MLRIATRQTLLLIASALVLPAVARAHSACPAPPLLGAHSISLEIFVGSTTLKGDDEAQSNSLFSEPEDREERFRRRALELVSSKLSPRGYSVTLLRDSGADNPGTTTYLSGRPDFTLSFYIYGYRLPRSATKGADLDGFSVTSQVFRDCGSGSEEEVTFEDTSLGWAPDARLEERLLSMFSSVIDEMLSLEACWPPSPAIATLSSGGNSEVFLTPPRFVCGTAGWPSTETPFLASVFSIQPDGVKRAVSTFPLINRAMPEAVLVSDVGDSVAVVAANDPKPVAIYKSDGSVVRALILGDLFTAQDRSTLSARYQGESWLAGAEIDDTRHELRLHLEPCPESDPECDFPEPRLRIDLTDGARLGPMSDVLPYKKGFVELSEDQPLPDSKERSSLLTAGCPDLRPEDLERLRIVSLRELLPEPSKLAMPVYTAIAQKARVAGTVSLDLVIDGSGRVVCDRIAKGLPLGLGTVAERVARSWSFPPEESDARLRWLRVTLSCELRLYAPWSPGASQH